MAARPEQLEGVRIRLMIICGRDVCMNHTSGDVVGRDNVGEDAVKKNWRQETWQWDDSVVGDEGGRYGVE